jgi:putative hydrolase of the HAD superfamily
MSDTRAVDDIEAVIFDWGGTLTPWHTIEPVHAWAAAVGDDELARRLLAAEQELWVRSRDEHRSGTLDEVFAAVGVAPTEAMLAAFSGWWEPHTLLDPEALPLFEALRARGIKIGILSNTLWTRAEHERIFDRDGVLASIDAAVYSSEIPWTKPHPEAFRAALDAVGVERPAAAVFVGDRPFDDIHGAKSVGMRAVLVPHSDIPDVQKGAVEGDPDAVIHRLGELLAVIDGWTARPTT